MENLQGKTIFIMGATRGIGRAVALRLASSGMHIAAAARNAAELEKLSCDIHALGGDCSIFTLDVLDYDGLQAALTQTQTKYGRIDAFYNGVSIGMGGTIETLTLDQIDAVIDVNLKGTIRCMKAVIPFMKLHGGNIINVSSMAGTRGLGTPPDYDGIYTATKWGIIGFDEVMEKYLYSRYRIRVSTLCPGTTDTSVWDRVPPAFSRDQMIPADYIGDVVVTLLSAPDTVVFKQVRLVSGAEINNF